MNIQENQYFMYNRMVLVIGLSTLALLLVIAPIGRHGSETQVIQAKHHAEVLALQLAQIYNQAKANRGPASEGDVEAEFKGEGYIGLDPWGKPYKYNILKTDHGIARIVVMSDGPDPAQSQNGTNADPSAQKIKVVITPSE